MKARNDSILVDECLKGNNRAFETLVRKYQSPIFNLALRMLKNREDASDVTQNVFVKAYEKLDSYNPKHQFFSWIYRIAINESINVSNKQKRVDKYESGVTAFHELTPEDNYKNGELSEAVAGAIKLLKIEHRLVLVLKHYHDFSYQEMSDVLGIPEKTVKSRLFSGRQRLKEILANEGIRE
jgi:RNA polymerase sigma-70 factor (ECF subfamily)